MARNRRNSRSPKIILDSIDIKKVSIALLIVIILTVIALVIRIVFSKQEQLAKEQKRQEEIALIFEEEDSKFAQSQASEQQERENEEHIAKVNMTILGNILCDESVYKSAYINSSYDFISMFKNVQNYTQEANISVAGLETNFVEEQYAGRAKYNSPKELATALSIIGIDVVNSATNHSFNYGAEGVNSTISTLNQNKIDVAGIKNENLDGKVVKEVNGIKIAFLSYTYGLNDVGEITDEQRSYVSFTDKEKMKQEIEDVKSQGAEYVCVAVHWQTSSNFKPTEEQKDIANYLAENGADIIIGTHPNEIETMEVKENSQGKNVLIVYSTGNFISSQSDVGIILQVQITKSVQGDNKDIWLSKVKYIPTYVYKNNGKYEILDVRNTVAKYENEDNKIVNKSTYNRLKKVLEEVEERIGNKKK